MYRFIPAEEKHLEQMVPLIASTGYWEAGLRRNYLNLPVQEFIQEFVAKSYLPFTTVIVGEDENIILGLITCGTKQELESNIVDYGAHVPEEAKELFKNLFTFEISDSYHIAFLAITKNSRGSGLGMKLMHLAEEKWKKSKLCTLSLYTFNCQTSAIQLYLKAGMMITHVFNVDDKVPCPCVLYFEKNTQTDTMVDYFETSAYQCLSF